jgi:ribokinase
MAAASSPLVVVGSVNADLVVESRLPQPGETVAATGGGVTLPGGKGANQAATAALLGYPTCFVGQTGRDAPAGVLLSLIHI